MRNGWRRGILVVTLVAFLAPHAQADVGARSASAPYVAGLTEECHHAGASALVASYLGELPGAPDASEAQPESPCFAIEPGETRALVRVSDDLAPRVSFWLGVRVPDHGWAVSSLHCSDAPVEVALPAGATRLAVIVHAATAGYCDGDDPALVWGTYESATFASTGTVSVAFS